MARCNNNNDRTKGSQVTKMASNILNILSKTSQVNIQDVLQGVVHTAVDLAERNQMDKHAILEIVNFMHATLSEHKDVCSEECLHQIADRVCLPLLPRVEVSLFGSKSRQLGADSQLYQALCQLLALCITTNKATGTGDASSNVISTRLKIECLKAISVYKEENDISGDTGAQVSSEKHLNIQTALVIIENIFEQMTKTQCKSISSDWIHSCFDSILSILEISQANVCARIAGVILPKILQLEPKLLQTRCSQVWDKVTDLYMATRCNSNIFVILCGLVNYFIPSVSNQEMDKLFTVVPKIEFWRILQSGLVHSDTLARKQSLFLIKRVIDWCSTSGCSIEVVDGDEGSSPMFGWTGEKRKQLVATWTDFFLLYETLQEVQVHVVKPVMPRLGKLIKAASTDQRDSPVLHSSWLMVIFHQTFVHETKTVCRWGVSQFLQLDLTQCPVMHQGGVQFVLHSVLEVLHEDSLYVRQPGTPLGICPAIVTDFKAFLQGCVKVLSTPELKAFLHNLLERICSNICGPVSLAFTMEALSELPRIPAWDQDSLKSLREFVVTGLIPFEVAYRSIIQRFLLTSALNLLDTSTITLQQFSRFLSALKRKECLERGKTTWNEVCEWIVANADSNLFNADGISLENQLSKDIVSLLTVEEVADANHDLSSKGEIDRVARTVVLLADALQLSIERGKSLLNSKSDSSTLCVILQPMSDVLCRISSHIYLPQVKADRALQLLLALLLELQPQSTLLQNNEDPTKREFEELMILYTQEVLTYLARKLLSHQIFQTTDLERLNFYMSLLDVIFTFWHKRLSDSNQGSYVQLVSLLRNAKDELMRTTLNALDIAETQSKSVEKLGKKVIYSKILQWLCSSTMSDVKSNPVKLDSLLAIQAVPPKTMQPLKNGELVSSQDWGKIQSQLLQCKWSCICHVLETKRLEDVSYVVHILEMCVGDLQLVSGYDALPMIQCATMLVDQVVSINSGICVDLMEASWCVVQDKWRSMDFWAVYRAFVKLTFHNCFLQPGIETILSTMVTKFKNQIFELGQGRFGMVNVLVSSICNTWADILCGSTDSTKQVVEGVTEHRELLLDACLFGPVCHKGARMISEMATYFLSLKQLDVVKHHILARSERDSGVVRATVVNFLLKLGNSGREDLKLYLCNFVIALLIKDQENMPPRKSYIINSLIHRQKQRAWQVALVLMPYIVDHVAQKLYEMIMKLLIAENQTSVRYLMEWTLIRLLHRFPVLHPKLWQDLYVLFDADRGNICPLLIVAAHLAAIQSTTEQKEAFYMKAIPVVMPWCLAQPQSLRTHGQLALYKLWKDCTEQGLTKVVEAFPAVSACMQFTKNHSTLQRLNEKVEQYFFAIHFHPVEDYTIQTIFYTLPAMSYIVEEEFLHPSVFEQESPAFWSELKNAELRLYNSRSVLEDHRLLQLDYYFNKAKESEAVELVERDVQKKVTPSQVIPGLDGLLLEETKSKGSLVLVTSLIDKPTNLGGLCRTSEIFGVSKLVIGSYRYVEDKQFTTLSVTAEKWLPIEEVKPNDLPQYLEDMRHDGYTLVGVEQTANSKSLTGYQFPERTLLLLGNERAGIPVDLIQLLDICVEIPQLGIVRSLNVHVSGALLVWEYTRQRLLNTDR